jgi:alanyl-tRNA synthetase
MPTIEEKIKYALRHIKRCGTLANDIFYEKKCNAVKFITANEALTLYNTYGMEIREVMFMVDSHGLAIDDLKEFETLINEQKERIKNSKQC